MTAGRSGRIAAPDALLADLRALLGPRATTSPAVREQHGKGPSYHAPAPPDVVAFPEGT